MKNVKEAMAVADEVSAKAKAKAEQKQNLEDLKNAKRKLKNWLLGIAFSVLPLLALPFSGFLKNGNLGEMLYNLVCDASILFVGISFTITSLNDFVADWADNYGWSSLTLFLLILGGVVYATTVVVENKDMGVVFGVNLFYFISMFLLSFAKYINEIRGIKNGNN